MRRSKKSNNVYIVAVIGLIVIIIIIMLKKKRKAIKDKENKRKLSFERLKKLKTVRNPSSSTNSSNTSTTSTDYSNKKTWDKHTDRRIDTLHPSIRNKVREFIIRANKELGIKLRVTSAMRSWLEQTLLYKQGRSAPGKIVTNAKAGESYHNYGLAFDVVEIVRGQPIWKNPKWQQIAKLGKSIGFKWGGDWRKPDWGHFDMTFGMHHSKLANLYLTRQKRKGYVLLT